MNVVDIILIALLVCLVAWAIRRIVRTRQSGGCGCGCEGCNKGCALKR
jgi:hypothetical protein